MLLMSTTAFSHQNRHLWTVISITGSSGSNILQNIGLLWKEKMPSVILRSIMGTTPVFA